VARERRAGGAKSAQCVAVPRRHRRVAFPTTNLKPGQASRWDLVPWVLAGAVLVSVAYVAWDSARAAGQLADAGRILAGRDGITPPAPSPRRARGLATV